MRLTHLVYILLITGVICSSTVYAQKEVTDSVDLSKTDKIASTDALYFDAIKAKAKDDSKQAKELFEQFAALKPNVPGAYYELAKLYDNDKNTDKATTYIQKAIALDSSNKWYKEEYANLLTENGKYDEAATVISELVKSEPMDGGYPLMAADYYERAKKYKEAVSYLETALLRNPGDEDILLHEVQLYLNLNDVDKAAGVVEQLINDDPRNGKYYKLLGELYDNNKLPQKATRVYDNAKKLIPDDPAVQLGIAEHYIKMGDTVSYKLYLKKAIVNKDIEPEAQLDFLKMYVQMLPDEPTFLSEGLPLIKQLVEQHADNATILAYYGDFLEAGNQHDSAVAYYKKALEIKPSAFGTWRNLLGSCTDKPDADSLIKYSEKFIRLFPTQAIGHYYNGIGRMNKGDYTGAAKAINRAIGMQPDNDTQILAAMYATLGDVYHSNHQDDLSDKSFEKALELSPDDATLLNNYSYYLSERNKRLDEAEKMSKRSLEIRPDEATYLDTYGWILYQKGDYNKAKEYIQQAVDRSGAKTDATLYDHLGNVYYKLNDKEKAIQYWKLSKEKGGDDPQLDKKITEGKLYE